MQRHRMYNPREPHPGEGGARSGLSDLMTILTPPCHLQGEVKPRTSQERSAMPYLSRKPIPEMMHYRSLLRTSDMWPRIRVHRLTVLVLSC